MTKYTAQDFENAKFAEHSDGRRMIKCGDEAGSWRDEYGMAWTRTFVAEQGFVPVPSKPTMTKTELETIVSDLSTYEGPTKGRIRRHLIGLGLTIVPDPEPTIPVPTEPGARFIAYSPKWSDGPEDQREFVVAGTSIVDIDTGNTFHRAAFADYWTVTDIVKAPGVDE